MNKAEPNTYFFIPGHRWQLSLAELLNFLQNNSVKYKILDANSNFFVLKTNSFIDLTSFYKLGGIIKWGTVTSRQNNIEYTPKITEIIKATSNISKESKVSFTVSIYSGTNQNIWDLKNKYLNKIKNWLKGDGYSARYIRGKELISSPVIFQKEASENGFELNILSGKNGNWIGFTEHVHTFEKYFKRDQDRPAIDPKSGMLPPKLAKIMVNLSQNGTVQTVWDPFCGSGTVLMEASLLKYNVIGTDISPKAITDSRNNLKWTVESKKDITRNKNKPYTTGENALSEEEKYIVIEKRSLSAIHKLYKDFGPPLDKNIAFVTEPDLGPAHRKPLNISHFYSISQKVENLISEFTNRIEYLQKKYGQNVIQSIVLVVPEYRVGDEWKSLKVTNQMNKLRKLGFETPSWVDEIQKYTSNLDLKWYKEDSLTKRNIWVLHKDLPLTVN